MALGVPASSDRNVRHRFSGAVYSPPVLACGWFPDFPHCRAPWLVRVGDQTASRRVRSCRAFNKRLIEHLLESREPMGSGPHALPSKRFSPPAPERLVDHGTEASRRLVERSDFESTYLVAVSSERSRWPETRVMRCSRSVPLAVECSHQQRPSASRRHRAFASVRPVALRSDEREPRSFGERAAVRVELAGEMTRCRPASVEVSTGMRHVLLDLRVRVAVFDATRFMG